MSNIADKIKIAQDKDGMLRRALERIIQLYTDRSHFVYELLQNAEDAQATCITFIQYPDRLEVMHNGKPFTAENLQGLCDIGKSDKVDNLNQIGEFGVGFKSVFGICDTVKLYSQPNNYYGDYGDAVPFAVEIVDFTSPVDIEAQELSKTITTKFVFPYTVGRSFSGFKNIDELNNTLSLKLQNLGITTLLFMKNLEIIEYKICLTEKTIEGEYLLDKKIINDHCSLISAIGLSDKKTEKEEKIEEISYLKFSKVLNNLSNRTVDIAFPVQIKEDGSYECKTPQTPYVSVYFPTETESKLGFIVQGPYRTTPNRSSIPADDEDNISLAKETAQLLRESLFELKETKKLNMSFIKVLPLNVTAFYNYRLFYPVYEMVKSLLSNCDIIPCRSGEYTSSKRSKIARQERIANLFTDDLLTELIADGNAYHWLSTSLTETNNEYKHVYNYFVNELKISVVRPEGLGIFFLNNPHFLEHRNDDWLIELYSILENAPAAFTKARNESNLLTANIVKTSTGKFVAPYRKTENKQYIHNIFLPSDKIVSKEINFVDENLYSKCKHFFDNILQLQKPNEYEFYIKDIEKRYQGYYEYDEEQHIFDIKFLIRYLKYEDYRTEVQRVINEYFVLKCIDGKFRNPYNKKIYVPITKTGVNLELYFKNIINDVFFADVDFYSAHGIDVDMLSQLGIRESIILYDNIIEGEYFTGAPGRQPRWWTDGIFKWKLTFDKIKEVLTYISAHPNAKDSIIKSKAIITLLIENEKKLSGTVYIGGGTPNLENETSEIIKILRGLTHFQWNGKWIFSEGMELVSPKAISKHDMSTSIYGRINAESCIYELLNFKKTALDEADDLRKNVPKKQLDAFFENELKQRFGISSSELVKYIPTETINTENTPIQDNYPFPVVKVKNWEALKKHAAEMLCFANPVKYDFKVRRIRISNKPKEARAYLLNMYRYDGIYKYACQICHEASSNIEIGQLFKKTETELDPMNLCLCPNCHAEYAKLRNGIENFDEKIKDKILEISENDVLSSNQVVVNIGGINIWFTQVHFAEIQSLIKLANEVEDESFPTVKNADLEERGNSNEKAGLTIYESYIGKQIRRKRDGWIGEIVGVDIEKEYIKLKSLSGNNIGETKDFVLSILSSEMYELM